MLKSLTFNGQRKEWLYLLEGREKSPFAPVNRTLTRVPGYSGAYLSDSNTDVLYIRQPVAFLAKNDEEALMKKEELASWLVTEEEKELQFDDEPNRTYYAVFDGTVENFVKRASKQYVGVLVFICPDPFKYGEEKIIEFSEDSAIIENKGTATAKPIIELTAKEKSTFAMVTLGDEQYNLLGEPADDDVQIVDTRTQVLYENGSTLSDWQVATEEMIDESRMPKIDGNMTTDGAGIRAGSYGSGDKLHGPAIFREIGPIQDFEIKTTFDINSRREAESWRMGINFLDENLNMLGHIGVKDNHRNYKRRVPLARFGPYRGGGEANGNLIGDKDKVDNARELTLFHLRATREGDKFSFFIGEWQSHRYVRQWSAHHYDIDKKYNGRLKYITLYIASFSDRPTPSRLRINDVEVTELATVQQDQTPYVIYPDDIITFDHVNRDILLNGEARNDLKNFGGTFFDMEKGLNTITISPGDTFDTRISFRERWR